MAFNVQLRRLAFVGAFGLLAATQASAHSFIAVSRMGNFTFGAAPVMVPINGASTVTPIFANPAGARFIVSYNAECAVAAAAGNSSTWMDVDVRAVNIGTGAVFTLTPTAGGLDAFCTSNGTAGNDGWQRVVVNAIGGPGMPAGNYRVQVRARLSGAGTGHLGDTSLIISR
jgi:hypothetical protein